MSLNRRNFLKVSGGAAAAACTMAVCKAKSPEATAAKPADPFASLTPMTDGIVPITDQERTERQEKARKLMVENKIDAIILEGGSSMYYFTGMTWGGSERIFAWVLPAKGEMAWVTPKFEEDRSRELIRFGTDIRTWEEDESPYKVIAGILSDRGIRSGKVGIEQMMRFFIMDGVRLVAPSLQFVNAAPVVQELRLIKSPAEIALMQKANDIAIAAAKAYIPKIEIGMDSQDIRALSAKAFSALGVTGGFGAQIDFASSRPHGSIKRFTVREGSIVLMDGGCRVVPDGYGADITRTIVYGTPSQEQRDMWNLALKAQAAAFAAARLGVPCEDVDAAARQVYVDHGFPGGYKLPGCPHRTGHGMGVDGHDGLVHLVKGNKRPLQEGMCFSNEPMLVIPDKYGIRIEDDFYMTAEGAKYFSHPPESIDNPV